MQGDILWNADTKESGRVLFRNGRGPKFIVLVDPKCQCGEPATVIRQGDTDTDGFDLDLECVDCAALRTQQLHEYFEALDIHDRPPPPGKAFLIRESAKNQPTYCWATSHTSYREAVKALRGITNEAASMGGLYPSDGIRIVDAEFAAEQMRDYRAWRAQKRQQQNRAQFTPPRAAPRPSTTLPPRKTPMGPTARPVVEPMSTPDVVSDGQLLPLGQEALRALIGDSDGDASESGDKS